MTPQDRRPRFPHPASRTARQGGADARARQGRMCRAPQPPRMRPQADLIEREDGFHLYLDMPGVAHEDLVLDVEGDELAVRGVTRFGDHPGNAPEADGAAPAQCGEPGGWRVHAMEFGDVEYHAVFTLSDMVDAARISAQLANGVLTIRMPKREAAAPRRIPVEQR